MSISAVLPFVQIVLAILLIGGILLQRSDAGLSSTFGGDGMGAGHYARRGAEKVLFRGTIVVAILFALSALVAIL